MKRMAVTLLCLILLAAPLAGQAPPLAQLHRIGVLWPGAAPPPGARMEWFRQGLRESGYVEGQNVAIDLRYAEAAERLRALAGELVQLKVSVIYTAGDLAPKIAQQATSAIPIVATADSLTGAQHKALGGAQRASSEALPGRRPLGPGYPNTVECD